MRGLDIADYLVIAEAILDVSATRLARQANLGALESALEAPFAGWQDMDVYPSLAQPAAVLCSRLVRNHPLIDGNKRAAFLSMLEFIARNGGEWRPPDPMEAAEKIECWLHEDERVEAVDEAGGVQVGERVLDLVGLAGRQRAPELVDAPEARVVVDQEAEQACLRASGLG